MTDLEAIALTIYGEARGESTDSKIAVGCVVGNRKKDGRWGKTFEAVCLAPFQFSCWNKNDPNSAMLHKLVGQSPKANAILKECYWIAEGILTDVVRPRVGKSTHYYAASIAEPKWAKGKAPFARVGAHLFFENIA